MPSIMMVGDCPDAVASVRYALGSGSFRSLNTGGTVACFLAHVRGEICLS